MSNAQTPAAAIRKGSAVLVHLHRDRPAKRATVVCTYEDGRTYGVRYQGGRTTNVVPAMIVTPA